MSNTASPLTIFGEEVTLGWKFTYMGIEYAVTSLTQGGSVSFKPLEAGSVNPMRFDDSMSFDQFRKWFEPPSKRHPQIP